MKDIPLIHQTLATGAQVNEVVMKIEPALEGVDRIHTIAACLTIALVAMNPYMSTNDLQEGVKGASEWISLFVSGRVDKELVEGAGLTVN